MVPPAPKPAQQPFDFFNADARQKLRGLQPQLPAAATTRRVRRRATRLRHIHGLIHLIQYSFRPAHTETLDTPVLARCKAGAGLWNGF